MTYKRAMVVAMLTAGLVVSVYGQTREKGPWWPHPIWGADDQAGGSNWITPEKVMQSIRLVKDGKIYELGHVYERDMPMYGDRTYAMFIPDSPTYGPTGSNNMVAHDDLLITEIGQVGTQFDGFGHVGKRMRMADGTEQDVFYNGVTRSEMHHPYGLRKLGIENVKPIITRGILVDIAGYKNRDVLPNSYEITLNDVLGALDKQDMPEENIRPGDAVFFKTGWSVYWTEPEKFNHNPAGIGMEVAKWIIGRKACMVGSDHFTLEVTPNPDEELYIPVHQELIMKNGILNLENMVFDELIADGVYEFLFIFTPVPFKGATGSPGRPVAIR